VLGSCSRIWLLQLPSCQFGTHLLQRHANHEWQQEEKEAEGAEEAVSAGSAWINQNAGWLERREAQSQTCLPPPKQTEHNPRHKAKAKSNS